MKPRWSKGLDDQQAKELKIDFDNSAAMRERLVVLLRQDIEASLIKMRSYALEVMPNLSEAYAAELSKQQNLLDIIKLIK